MADHRVYDRVSSSEDDTLLSSNYYSSNTAIIVADWSNTKPKKTEYTSMALDKFQFSFVALSLQQALECWRITLLREIHENKFIYGCTLLADTSVRKPTITKEDLRLRKYFLHCKEIENLLSGALNTFFEIGNLGIYRKFIGEKYRQLSDSIHSMRREMLDKSKSNMSYKSAKEDLVDLDKLEKLEFELLEDHKIQTAIEYRLVKNWEAARIDQQEYFYFIQEKTLCDESDNYRILIQRETDYKTQQDYSEVFIEKLITKLDELQAMYEKKQDELDHQHQYLQSTLSNATEKLDKKKFIYGQRSEEIFAVKKKRAITTIQAWWRKVRQGILPAKNNSKKSKKKGKQRKGKQQLVAKKEKAKQSEK